MIIEISYSYKADKISPVQKSWTYFFVKGDDFNTVVKDKAKKYFTSFIKDHGWAKKSKILEIHPISKANEIPTTIIVNSSELPPARKRRSTPQPPKVRPKARASSRRNKV